MSDSVWPHRRQPPGSPIPGILQARTLEWVAISFSNAWKWKVRVSCSVVSDSEGPHGLPSTRLLFPWDFAGKSTGVGCHCLLRALWLCPSYSTPKYLPKRNKNIYPHKPLHKNICSSFVHNSPTWRQLKYTTIQCINKLWYNNTVE